MNPYEMLGSAIGTNEAATLSLRLSAWHDAMVAHERRLRLGTIAEACHDKDTGSGPAHECHEFSEASTDEKCSEKEDDCLSSCGAEAAH